MGSKNEEICETIALPIHSTGMMGDVRYDVGINPKKGLICFYTTGKKKNIQCLMSLYDFIFFRKVYKDLEKDIEDMPIDTSEWEVMG